MKPLSAKKKIHKKISPSKKINKFGSEAKEYFTPLMHPRQKELLTDAKEARKALILLRKEGAYIFPKQPTLEDMSDNEILRLTRALLNDLSEMNAQKGKADT